MQFDIFNQKGDKLTRQIILSDSVFNIEPNLKIINNVVVIQQKNKQQGTHKVKNRSEVSGGGRKPWKQKGTGRARQGSIRSPQWRHGGVVFGPKPYKTNIKINKKIRKLAWKSLLSFLAQKKKIKIIEKLTLETPKTKSFLIILKSLKLLHNTSIFLDNELEKNILLSSRNLKNILIKKVSCTSLYEILKYKNLILTELAVKYYEKVLSN